MEKTPQDKPPQIGVGNLHVLPPPKRMPGDLPQIEITEVPPEALEAADRFLFEHPIPTRDALAHLIASSTANGAIAASMAPANAPTYIEHKRITDGGQSPEDFAVIEADGQVQQLAWGEVNVPPARGGGKLPALLATVLVVIPAAWMRTPRVLDGRGKAPNPLDGAPNLMRVRALIRTHNLSDEGKRAIGLEPPEDPKVAP